MKNILSSWKTTILGLIIFLANFYYLIKSDGQAIIFFGMLLVSFGLFFAPDDLIKGIKNLIKKNQNKEI
jgi:hypothetical protein